MPYGSLPQSQPQEEEIKEEEALSQSSLVPADQEPSPWVQVSYAHDTESEFGGVSSQNTAELMIDDI